MRICVLSDIHGNGAAFREAIHMIKKEAADINLFLGDLCGYYYSQTEIFEKILSLPNLMVCLGNHDQIYLQIHGGDENLRRRYREAYGHSIEKLLESRDMQILQWLATLQYSCSIPDFNVVAYHGSPWNPLEGYVYPDSQLEPFCDLPHSVFILGHTHYPMKRTLQGKLVVNPGSLGQPRNSRWPTYALLDLPAQSVTFREVLYDRREVLNQISKYDDHNTYLKDVLLRTRGDE